MSEYTDKLRSMINNAPEESDNIANSIAQIEDQIEELQEQDDAIVNAMMNVDQTSLEIYLQTTKLQWVRANIDSTASLNYGPNFATIDYTSGGITDWSYEGGSGVVYEYEGVNWDSDATIITYVEDYAFGNDYLTRPLTSGAAYGIRPYISSLNDALDILNENKDKIDESITVFENYAS